MSETQPGSEVARSDESGEPHQRRRAFRLPTWERWVAGGLGTAGGFAGIWAIIVSGKDGAGSVALIVASIVFWIIALVGVIPYKLWGKDMGYELGEIEGARKVAAAVADEVSPEKMQEIVNATVEAPVVDRQLDASTLNYVVKAGLVAAQQDMETFVRACDAVVDHAVRSLDKELGAVSVESVLADVDYYDRRITTDEGKIFVAYKRRVTHQSLNRLIKEFLARANTRDKFLIITQEPTDFETIDQSRVSTVTVLRLSAAPRLLPLWLRESIKGMQLEAPRNP